MKIEEDEQANNNNNNTISTSSKKKRKTKKTKKVTISQEDQTSLISLIASATSLSHTFLSQNDLLLLPSQTLTLESSIKSTALSLSHLLSLQTLKPHPPPPPLPPPPPSPHSSSSWFHRFLSSPNPRFLDAFRISKPSFHLLLQTLSPSLQPPADSTLAAALFRLAHAAPYKSVARRFGLDSATAACRAFYQVCKAINDRLFHLFDLMPQPNRDFSTAPIGLPGCHGVLGYSRFFTDHGTVIVQGLVDSDGRFLDVSAGWPGSMNPESILRLTRLYSRVTESKEILNGASFELAGGNSIGPYVLGDYCCPLLPWLITPYPRLSENEDNSRRLLNAAHGHGMELANNAFGRVLVRWRLLSTRWKQECLEFFPFVVVAGCLLHNFLIDCGETALDDIGDYMKEQRFPEFCGNEDESGEKARDALALHLSMVSQKE